MLKNNHFSRVLIMDNRNDIDALLRSQSFPDVDRDRDTVYQYAASMAAMENCLAVVSDLKANTSRIFNGRFGQRLGLGEYSHENSIWEQAILDMMDETERAEKYLAELRFFNFLRHIPTRHRQDYYLISHLRFNTGASGKIDIMHRMYYWHESGTDIVRYGICIYGPMTYPMTAKSMAVNSITGESTELAGASDNKILSKRERQILSLIETGMTSQAIADRLCISKHTVSRHRQSILANLQARNSTEAIRRAKQLNLL